VLTNRILVLLLVWVVALSGVIIVADPAVAQAPPAERTGKSAASNSLPQGAKTGRPGGPSLRRHVRPHRRTRISPARLRRLRRAFVASSDLKAMAQQLLQDRSPQAYAAVETYAGKHAAGAAAPLAWLVLGYARLLDRNFSDSVRWLKRAQPRAGELRDYVDYLLASAQQQSGGNADAVVTLQDFAQRHAQSILQRDMALLKANSLLVLNKARPSIAILESYQAPPRADVELALGRAYAAAGETTRATETLNGIYYGMPLAAEADAAHAELLALGKKAEVAGPSLQQRKMRAELLMKGRRYAQAADEYDALARDFPSAEFKIGWGASLYHEGRTKEARKVLEDVSDATGELNAERLYWLSELARSRDDRDQQEKLVTELRALAPQSPWFEEALLSAANMRMLRHDYERALDFLTEFYTSFPGRRHASHAHWRAAWLTYRIRKSDEAARLFDEHLKLYPASTEVPNALYWRARLAEDQHDPQLARAYYQKLADRFQHYYYADLARERLLTYEAVNCRTAELPNCRISIPQFRNSAVPQSSPDASQLDPKDFTPPADDLRLHKAQLLSNGALFDFAIRELQEVLTDGGLGRHPNQPKVGSGWAVEEIARLDQERGRYDLAIEAIKRYLPAYFSRDIAALPRSLWEALFPRTYWRELRTYALANHLDPFLVAALVRQESEFNPVAVSTANALGLMQLLPATGKRVAREARLRHFQAGMLFDPAINLELGTRYFKRILDSYDGRVAYALAAYNAGRERVDEWRKDGDYRDVAEFVESIPFTETREYVQAVMRNSNLYHRLYGNP